jgi:hypothetical protein
VPIAKEKKFRVPLSPKKVLGEKRGCREKKKKKMVSAERAYLARMLTDFGAVERHGAGSQISISDAGKYVKKALQYLAEDLADDRKDRRDLNTADTIKYWIEDHADDFPFIKTHFLALNPRRTLDMRVQKIYMALNPEFADLVDSKAFQKKARAASTGNYKQTDAEVQRLEKVAADLLVKYNKALDAAVAHRRKVEESRTEKALQLAQELKADARAVKELETARRLAEEDRAYLPASNRRRLIPKKSTAMAP